MHAAVHVGVVFAVVTDNGVQDLLRLLRGGGVIQVHQRLAVHSLRQDRKVAAHPLHVVAVMSSGSHRTKLSVGVGGGCHPTSSQCMARSCAPLPAPGLPGLMWNSDSLTNSSMRARTGPGFMRSRHSLAKAKSSRRRAADGSMPRERRSKSS